MFNTGFYCVGGIIGAWAVLAVLMELIFRNAMSKYYKQILMNDATNFDEKGELLEFSKQKYAQINEVKNQDDIGDVEMKNIVPPRKLIKN